MLHMVNPALRVDTWILKTTSLNKLEDFEMWIDRYILKIKWTAKMTERAPLNKQIKVKNMPRSLLCNTKYYIRQLIKGIIVGK